MIPSLPSEMSKLLVRKTTRLAPINYLGFQHYFVTLCCFHRQKLFSDRGLCKRVLLRLQMESATRFFRVHAYCVMPDHLHFLIEGIYSGSNLLDFMKSFKIKTSRAFARRETQPLWQRGYYEHILRSGEPVESVAWYIWFNPVRKGLVSKPQEYSFAGSFTGMKMPSSWGEPNWVPPWKKTRWEKSGPPQKADPTISRRM